MAAREGTFVANGVSQTFNPPSGYPFRAFNVTISGTFVATVKLERSFNQGATWHGLTAAGTPIYVWTAPGSESVEENESGVQYRLNCTWTSGTVVYRLGGP